MNFIYKMENEERGEAVKIKWAVDFFGIFLNFLIFSFGFRLFVQVVLHHFIRLDLFFV